MKARYSTSISSILDCLINLKLRRLDANGFEVIDFNDGQYRFAMGKENFVDTLAKDFPAERTGPAKHISRKSSDICQAFPCIPFQKNNRTLLINDDI